MAEYPYSTARWQRLRKAHLSIEPLCRGCRALGRLTVANTVDHATAISDGGHPFPAHDGLTSYCPSCHAQKTARGTEAGAVRTTRALQPRKGCDANGNPLDPSHPWSGKSLKAGRSGTAVPLPTQLVYNRSRGDGRDG